MNYYKLFLFSILLTIGATNQVKGNTESNIGNRKQFINKATLLLVNGVQRLIEKNNNEEASRIETELSGFGDLYHESYFAKKYGIGTVGHKLCLNLTDTLENLSNLVNNVTNLILSEAGDLYKIANVVANCSTTETSDVLNIVQCLENALILIRNLAEKDIAEVTDLLSNIVSIVLTTLEDVLNCFSDSNSVIDTLFEITNKKYRTGNNLLNYNRKSNINA